MRCKKCGGPLKEFRSTPEHSAYQYAADNGDVVRNQGTRMAQYTCCLCNWYTQRAVPVNNTLRKAGVDASNIRNLDIPQAVTGEAGDVEETRIFGNYLNEKAGD